MPALPEKKSSSGYPEDSEPTNKTTDFFVGSKYVKDLTCCNFSPFLRNKDVVLVMFYDPWNPKCCYSKKHFDVASKTTPRPNAAYAAVNCLKEPYLCSLEGTSALPFFKMYARGRTVETFTNSDTFTSSEMRAHVNSCPVPPY